MKPFLIFVFISFSQILFGQKTTYFTVSFNYTDFTHSDYYSGTNFQQNIGKATFKPSFAVGLGRRFSVTKKFHADFLISLNRMTGKANYRSNYTWMNTFEGEMTYKLIQLQFIPDISFQLDEKVNLKIGLLNSLNIFNNSTIGTSTSFGYYDNGFHQYPTPIVNKNVEDTYTDLPWLSAGIISSINYKLTSSLELFGRYIHEKSININRLDSFAINQFGIGINYYFN